MARGSSSLPDPPRLLSAMQTRGRGQLRLIVGRRRAEPWAGYVAVPATLGVDEILVATGFAALLVIQVLLIV